MANNIATSFSIREENSMFSTFYNTYYLNWEAERNRKNWEPLDHHDIVYNRCYWDWQAKEDQRVHAEMVFHHEDWPRTELREQEYYTRYGIDPELFYKDQAPSLGIVSAFYTSYGIQQIDKWFCDTIMEYNRGESKYTYEQLADMVLKNPHLHVIIKANLFYNIQKDEHINRR